MRLLSTVRGAFFALTLTTLAFAGTVSAEEAHGEAFHPPLLVAPALPAATAPALQAAIDPVTGMLRPPTTGERIHLASLARQSSGIRRAFAASQTVHPDGMISMALDPTLHSLSTALVAGDGRLHFACGDAGHLHTTTVTAPATEDR